MLARFALPRFLSMLQSSVACSFAQRAREGQERAWNGLPRGLFPGTPLASFFRRDFWRAKESIMREHIFSQARPSRFLFCTLFAWAVLGAGCGTPLDSPEEDAEVPRKPSDSALDEIVRRQLNVARSRDHRSESGPRVGPAPSPPNSHARSRVGSSVNIARTRGVGGKLSVSEPGCRIVPSGPPMRRECAARR